MPYMNGYEMITNIRKFNTTIPIIITSGNSDRLDIYEKNIYTFPKPIDISDFLRMITEIC